MSDQQWLAEHFEEHRSRLRAVAYRMLGSLTEADDAVQDAWLRVSRADSSEVENLGAWLTTISEQWKVVDAFLAAARNGDFDALVAVLDPDVVLRADGGTTGLSHHARGAEAVAGQATMWSQAGLTIRRALVNGAAGLVSEQNGRPFSVGAFTIQNGKIVECDFLVDPERLARLDLRVLAG
jgi:limonene-1,2-epoxide hydrolase